MCINHLKIIVISNTPSNQALKNFHEKLYQVHKNKKIKEQINPINKNIKAKLEI
jgi:hypothetical protein